MATRDDSRQRTEPRDRGSGILLVLVTMTILSVVASVAVAAAVSTLRQADRSQDWNASLAAAEAGVADYLARLNANDQYWQTTDCANVALKRPLPSGGGCGWGSTTPVGWRSVPVEGADRAFFHYDVDVRTTYTNGAIVLTSTGRVGKVTRTVQVRLRRGGFGEFLYYTVYETVDPANDAVYGVGNTYAQENCPKYRWAGRPTASISDPRYANYVQYYCQAINFVTGDRINGPLHTNDSLLISGSPVFKGTTTTSLPACRAYEGVAPPQTSCYLKNGSASPVFERGISYRAEVALPTTIGDLRKYVTPGQTAKPGCLYTGPTRIKFLPTAAGSTPKMQVWSKWTTAADLNSGCGTAGTASGQLGHSAGATVTVPQDNLIYLQDVPSNRSTPSSSACKTTGGIGDGLPKADTGSGYPDYDLNLNLTDANCRYGTAWIQGTVKGRVTIATDNNVIVTGDVLYAGGETGNDSLGLIAKNSVKIYHPVKCTRIEDNQCTAVANLTGTLTNVTVNAAMLTLQHSFTVQLYNVGAKLGTLKVFGSIAQNFRGPVGTSANTGYLKDYNYDTRLRYAPPPYFLDPVRAGWGQKTFAEVAPQYG